MHPIFKSTIQPRVQPTLLALNKRYEPTYPDLIYTLAKGKGNNPRDMATCSDGSTKEYLSVENDFAMIQMPDSPPRVKSRFRVSPSPRKIPQYELEEMIDNEMTKLQLNFMGGMMDMVQLQLMRDKVACSLPRFR